MIPDEVKALKLPRLASHHSLLNGKAQFDAQTYADFAMDVLKKNKDVHLTKETVDEAFRMATARITKTHRVKDLESSERMLLRVGK